MNKSRHTPVFTLLLIAGDVLAILGAYSLAYIFRVKLSDTPVANFVSARDYFASLILLIPLIILVFSLIGSYSTSVRKKRPTQLIRLFIGALTAMLLMIAVDYFYNDHIFPAKLVPLYGFIFSIGLLGIIRGLLHLSRWLWYRLGKGASRIVIVGDSPVVRSLIHTASRKGSGYKLQAVVGDMRLNFTTHKTFKEAVKHQKPDIIIQVATNKQPTLNQELLNYSINNYTDLKFIPSDIHELTSRAKMELFGDDIPVLDIRQTSLGGWGRVAKRLFDVLVSVLLLIILSPILLIIAIVNYFVFGKIVFGQTRLTRGNQKFKLYKFQTVRKDLNGLSPEEAFAKIGKPELAKKYRANGDFLPNDPRYGAWARFLRKTSLDELPQLFNVLKSDISLVGPRALVPEELSSYDNKHLILSVKSGVTGLAQISGRRNLAWEERRNLDVYYAQNWSFRLDMQILINTAWQVLTGRGAE